MVQSKGYTPPPYPYDRLNELKVHGERFAQGLIDLSIGTPMDQPPQVVLDAMAGGDTSRSYPPSIGTFAVRQAVADWFERRVGVTVDPAHVAATVGSKEFVVTTARHLHLRRPDRDTVLYPAIAYPSYAMSAELGGLRAVAVPVDDNWRLDLAAIEPADAARAVCLWVNSPANPAGALEDLGVFAAWGRAHDVTVLSDECYLEFTWGDAAPGRATPGRSILEHGSAGVLAVHSLSKRSSFAGGRFGFYSGDPDLVWYLSEVRKHVGAMVPGSIQAGAAAALADDSHVDVQRELYQQRIDIMADILNGAGIATTKPEGGFYLWVQAPDGDAWALASWLAERGGALVSPGEFYGPAGAGHVRVAVVQPVERLAVIGDRLAQTGRYQS